MIKNRKHFIKEKYAKYWINARKDIYKITPYDRAIIKLLKSVPSFKILEVGIGTGEVIAESFISDKEVYGVDISDDLISRCKELFPGINAEVGDAEKLSFKDALFDLVFCIHTTWYFPDLKKAIFEMLRVTKKGGYVIFDIQNIQNHEINEIYKKHIYENSNFFGKFYKTCKNFIKLILRKGITEWDFAIYEVPSDPLSIINELRLKKIDDFQTLVPVTKDNITTLIEIQSDFDMYPRIIFLVKI